MTDDPILRALEGFGLKAKGSGKYRCKSPFRADSDSDSFTYDAVKGVGHDKVLDTGYNRYQLAQHFGIELADDENTKRQPVTNTLRTYESLADYALEQGVSVSVFEVAKWQQVQYQNRPAFSFPTQTGIRYRFIDGKKPKYKSSDNYKSCWYGLKNAIAMQKNVLVLCNGEASTIVAQHFGVPAFCKTAGEMHLPDYLIQELREKWQGEIWIALDCDDTGRKTAQKITEQLPGAKVLDLGLSDKGDLANYCKLHTQSSMDDLRALLPAVKPPAEPPPDMVYADSVAVHAIREIELDRVQPGYPLMMPLKSFHRLNGGARIIPPGKTMLIIAPTAGGKTSFLETLVDAWLRRGIGGMWRGDEWTPEEYHYRRVQRYGGIDSNSIISHELWKQETARGIPEHLKQGERLTDNQILHYQETSMGLAEWQGKLQYYVAERSKKTVESMLDIMTQHLAVRRKSGEIVGFAVFDYAQLLKASSKPVDDNVVEHVFGLVKEWGIDNSIVCLLGSQVTKSASEGNRENKLINLHDAQYLRADKAYIAIVLNTIYEDHPSERNPNGTPKRVQTDRAIASVVKNSNGSTGDVDLLTDFQRLQWLDSSALPRMDMPERHERHYANEA